MSRVTVVLVGLLMVFAAEALAASLHVAADGNDAWSGQHAKPSPDGTDGPLATLAGARDAVRALKAKDAMPSEGLDVVLHGGIYTLSGPVEFSEADSGTAARPIVYRAASDASARIMGGRVVTGFGPVEGAARERLDEAARDHVLQADLNALDLDDFGAPSGGGIEVFFDNEPMTLSRWPNEGFVRIADIVEDDGHKIHGHKGSKTGKFVYAEDRPARWAGEKDAWVHGYWFWDWSEQRHRVRAIDPDKRVIEVEPPYHGYGYRKNQWYYGFNLLCELDRPGEWYVDREAGMLYFWPPAPIDSAEVVVSSAASLIRMKGVSHVVLWGLSFEASRATALSIEGGEGNRVIACVVRNTGGSAVRVAGGKGHLVAGCDMYNMGSGGISLAGGDRKTLTPAGHEARNNHIHHYARWNRVYQAGIHLNGVGNRAMNNLIENAPHMAVGFGGNDHRIEFNEIHSVCYESNDAGAIYTGRDWTMRGTVIRYNHLHDITGFEGRGCVGVYLDDMFCGVEISGNLFRNVTRAAFVGGGRDCTIANNIFVDCKPAVHVDARALGWAHYHADEWIKEAKEKKTLKGVKFLEAPYSERYPQLLSLIDDEPKAPKGNVVARNVSWGGKWNGIYKEAAPHVAVQANLIDVDPHFVDVDKGDYRLRDDSPAFELGFQQLPIEKMGLYASEERASWPVTHAVRGE